ncbi:MAG: MurR/RpiR family transcriptional regulator [Holophaga sp.]|nr:MurR/RpiR family transcriptional regulator [Holophaga sp.]
MDLSSSQRRITECLQANMHEAAMWGVEELANESQTCVATVVRFAKKLGYSGYLEMRKALVSSAKKHYQRGDQLLDAPAQAAATLVEVARRDIRNIELLVQAVDEDLLQGAARLLKSSRMRLIIGDGVSALMARQLAYLLINTGIPAMEGNPADFASQVGILDSRDLLIAISITPYTRETLDAAAYARKRSIPVLAFSDGDHSPLAKIASLALPIPGKNLLFSHSLAAFGVLAHALATTIAREDPKSSLKKLHEVERVARPKFTDD